MLAFFLTSLRNKWKSWLIQVISTVSFLEMYVVIFPSIAKQSEQIDTLIKSLPSQIYAAFNMNLGSLSFSNLQSFLSTEYMSFLWPITLIILIFSIANDLFVNEIDQGTIETAVSMPASRIRIFVERYLAGFLMVEIFTIVTILGTIPLAILQNIDYEAANYMNACAGSMLFAWAIYSMVVAISTFCSEKRISNIFSGGVIMIMYVLNVVASLANDFKNLKYFSFFHYFDGSNLLLQTKLEAKSIIVFVVCSVVFTIISLVWFKKRDLSV